jgi:hypothetical protein
LWKKLDTSIYKERFAILMRYDMNEYGWLTRAVKEIGLFMAEIRLILKKAGIVLNLDRHTPKKNVEEMKIKLSLYDKTRWGWIAQACRDLQVSNSAIIKYCKRFGWEYKICRLVKELNSV